MGEVDWAPFEELMTATFDVVVSKIAAVCPGIRSAYQFDRDTPIMPFGATCEIVRPGASGDDDPIVIELHVFAPHPMSPLRSTVPKDYDVATCIIWSNSTTEFNSLDDQELPYQRGSEGYVAGLTAYCERVDAFLARQSVQLSRLACEPQRAVAVTASIVGYLVTEAETARAAVVHHEAPMFRVEAGGLLGENDAVIVQTARENRMPLLTANMKLPNQVYSNAPRAAYLASCD